MHFLSSYIPAGRPYRGLARALAVEDYAGCSAPFFVARSIKTGAEPVEQVGGSRLLRPLDEAACVVVRPFLIFDCQRIGIYRACAVSLLNRSAGTRTPADMRGNERMRSSAALNPGHDRRKKVDIKGTFAMVTVGTAGKQIEPSEAIDSISPHQLLHGCVIGDGVERRDVRVDEPRAKE